MNTRTLVRGRVGGLILAVAMTMGLASAIYAADGTWNTDGDGLWTDSAKWSGNAIANGADFTAYFTAELTTATRTVTLNGDRTIGNITFTDGTTSSHDLAISGANTLTLDVTSGAPTINVTQSDRTLTIGSAVKGNEGLTKNGSGTLALAAANNYSGTTTLSVGALQLGHATSMGSSTLTMASGTTLQLRNDLDTIFTAPITTPAGAGTYNFDVNNAGGAVTGKKLSLGNLTFATSTANQINVTGANSYTLGLGTISHPSGSGGPWAFTINPSTAAVKINKFSTGSYGTALTFTGSNNASLGELSLGSNGGNTLQVNGSVVTLGITTAFNNRNSTSVTVAYTLTSGTLNLTTTTSIANARVSGTGNAPAPTFVINGGTLNNTSGSALTLGGLVSQTQNNKPTITLGGNFAFGTADSTSANDLSLGTSDVPLGANRSITVNGTTTLTLAGIVSGAFTLTKNGTGTLTLGGLNTFTGKTTVSGGTLEISAAGKLYSGTANYYVVQVDSGATLMLAAWNYGATGGIGNSYRTATDLLVNGGTITYANNGAAEDVIDFSGRLMTIGAGGATLNAAGSALWTITPASANNYQDQDIANGLILTGSGNGVHQKNLTGSGGAVSKSGSGTWTLSGVNTYTGQTTINAGTLRVSANSGLGAVATGSQVNLGGGTLSLNGTFTLDNGGSNKRNMSLTATSGIGVTAGNTATISGVISSTGAFGLTKSDDGTLILSGNNTYSGGTTVSAGTLTMGHANALGSTSGQLTVNGATTVLNMASHNLTVGNLTGNHAGSIIQGSSGARTLTIGQGDNGGGNYQGIIADGSGGTTALTKTGNGTITLSGANTYTGTTTINAGTLALGANNTLDTDNDVILAGGTLDMGTYDNALGALTVTDDSTIALGTGAGTLSFNSATGWTAGKRLALTGTLGETKLKFESSLTPEQLACMSCNGQAVAQNASGYVIDAERGTVYLLR